jgi:hypothetical protein
VFFDGSPFVESEWNHLVFVFDPATGCRVYLNGVFDFSFPSTYAGPDGPFGCQVASDNDPSGLDLVGMWDRILTFAEIQALYNAGSGFDPTVPIT